MQYPVAKSLYETQLYCDFIIYHPEKHEKCLIIESKWQQSAGSVDEKFPYLVLNIRERYPCSTIVVLDGGGYKKGAEKWLRDQIDDKLIHIFSMMEFQKWSNSEEL
ncbi:MAG: PD-(D/E)XK nuclease superfamily protein [bacterium]